jgi:hypothetical protein
MKKAALGVILVAVMLPSSVFAKPKRKAYNNSADQVFAAALRTARERHVVTYVDEKTLMMTFETGRSFTSQGFVANASVEAEGPEKSTLIINVQNKQGLSWGAGDRMADKFYEQVTEELSGETKQKAAVKQTASSVAVPEPKAVPPEPSMTRRNNNGDGDGGSAKEEKGTVMLASTPDGAEVYVDDAFVGNAPATLKLGPGKHTVKVSEGGYKPWSKELNVYAGSEVRLKAVLLKE